MGICRFIRLKVYRVYQVIKFGAGFARTSFEILHACGVPNFTTR